MSALPPKADIRCGFFDVRFVPEADIATSFEQSLYWAPKFLQSLWNAKEIFITENGCAGEDVLADDGNIYDTEHIMFMRAYLTELQRAAAEGVPVKGYFYWSTMDNFRVDQGLP